jgi:Bacterial regulatory proteins, gntR family
MDCVTCQTATFVIEQLRHSGTSECKKGTKGRMPAYQRIQSPIRKRIEAGQLCPGDAVKSERELARIHQVSLMTARCTCIAGARRGS